MPGRKDRRVILINGWFLLRPITGVQRHARAVLTALGRLEQDRYRFIVAAPGPSLGVPESMDFFEDPSSLPGVLWQQFRLPILMKKLGASLLWSPGNIGPVLLKDQVVTIHDAAVYAGGEWFSWQFRIYYRVLLKLIGRRARLAITDSKFSKEELVKYDIASISKIRVVYSGVDKRFTSVPGMPYDFPYVLTLGSRDPRKNVNKLIEAWRLLSVEAKKGSRLVVAGGGGRSFASEGIKNVPSTVYFAGFVEDKNLPALYSGARAFVYPSLYEGFGLPPLEAMACGCPVVASNAASLPEICGDAAYYVDPHNIESIAEGTYKVLTDNALKQNMIKKGLERAKLFSWEKSAREHLTIFDEILI